MLPEMYPLPRGGGAADALVQLQTRLLRGELRGDDGLSLEHPSYWAAWTAFGTGVAPESR